MRHEDPYALYNPPYPRLPCGPQGPGEAVALVLALHAAMLEKVLADGRWLDPAHAEDPPPAPPLAEPRVDGDRLKNAFDDTLAGVGLVEEEGLALLQDARAALARTPIPALARPGRLSGRWPASGGS